MNRQDFIFVTIAMPLWFILGLGFGWATENLWGWGGWFS